MVYLERAPRVADWVCEVCDAARPHLSPLLRGHAAPTPGSDEARTAFDCDQVERLWLNYHGQETRDLRLMQDGVAAMRGMAGELSAEHAGAVAALAMAEAEHAEALAHGESATAKLAMQRSTVHQIRTGRVVLTHTAAPQATGGSVGGAAVTTPGSDLPGQPGHPTGTESIEHGKPELWLAQSLPALYPHQPSAI